MVARRAHNPKVARSSRVLATKEKKSSVMVTFFVKTIFEFMSILSFLTSIAGVSMGLSSIPQIIKIFKRKSAKDVSKSTHFIIVLGALIWMLYGFEIQSFPIIISNFVGILTNGIILWTCFTYK